MKLEDKRREELISDSEYENSSFLALICLCVSLVFVVNPLDFLQRCAQTQFLLRAIAALEKSAPDFATPWLFFRELR